MQLYTEKAKLTAARAHGKDGQVIGPSIPPQPFAKCMWSTAQTAVVSLMVVMAAARLVAGWLGNDCLGDGGERLGGKGIRDGGGGIRGG